MFVRDPTHWLLRSSPEEWLQSALLELSRARAAYAAHNGKAALVAARRAAGMACNARLIFEPDTRAGRSYLDHVKALAAPVNEMASGRAPDPTPGIAPGIASGIAAGWEVPDAVRSAARLLLTTPYPTPSLVQLRSPAADEQVLSAARTVIAAMHKFMQPDES